MTYSIIIEKEAQYDLLNIYQYISKNDFISKAKKFILELEEKIKTLENMPFRCRKSHYTDDENIRDLIYKKYTIVFKIVNKNIHILTIFRQKAY